MTEAFKQFIKENHLHKTDRVLSAKKVKERFPEGTWQDRCDGQPVYADETGQNRFVLSTNGLYYYSNELWEVQENE